MGASSRSSLCWGGVVNSRIWSLWTRHPVAWVRVSANTIARALTWEPSGTEMMPVQGRAGPLYSNARSLYSTIRGGCSD